MLGLLAKFLVLVAVAGIAVRLGLSARLADALPETLQNRIRVLGSQADPFSLLPIPAGWPSLGTTHEFLGSLPAPWGGLAGMLLILTSIALVLSLMLALFTSFARMLRWLRDMMI